MKCQDIKPFTSCGSYYVNMTMQQLVDSIARDERDMGLILESEFQRGHVWTKEQQIAYIEYFLKGGMSGRDLYFNHPDWYHKSEGNYHDYVCVDGLQRITAVRRFMKFLHLVFIVMILKMIFILRWILCIIPLITM